jgi:DNA-binding response OmpR family regulator
MNKKIFIIEDDVNILYGLQAKFRVEGFDVQLSSGEEELRHIVDKISLFEADYLILDLILPNVDGFDIIRRVREEIGNSLPIFVFSDVSENDIQSRAHDFGANYYFIKDEINIDEFVERVTRIIRNKEKDLQ